MSLRLRPTWSAARLICVDVRNFVPPPRTSLRCAREIRTHQRRSRERLRTAEAPTAPFQRGLPRRFPGSKKRPPYRGRYILPQFTTVVKRFLKKEQENNRQISRNNGIFVPPRRRGCSYGGMDVPGRGNPSVAEGDGLFARGDVVSALRSAPTNTLQSLPAQRNGTVFPTRGKWSRDCRVTEGSIAAQKTVYPFGYTVSDCCVCLRERISFCLRK